MTFFISICIATSRNGVANIGLGKFDLWTALFIPYFVATSCVVIAAGARFNGKPESAYDSKWQILYAEHEKDEN